jgi:hypothetical protein
MTGRTNRRLCDQGKATAYFERFLALGQWRNACALRPYLSPESMGLPSRFACPMWPRGSPRKPILNGAAPGRLGEYPGTGSVIPAIGSLIAMIMIDRVQRRPPGNKSWDPSSVWSVAQADARSSGARWHTTMVVDTHPGLANSPKAAFESSKAEVLPTFALQWLECARQAISTHNSAGSGECQSAGTAL